MATAWNLAGVTAVGVGVGAAFAASMGPIGWILGLGGAFATFVVSRVIRRRPRA